MKATVEPDGADLMASCLLPINELKDVVLAHPGMVTMKTRVGGMRVVDMLSGEQLPRIC